jgi:cell shape-determining protein MreC
MDTAVSPFYFISNGPRELLDSVSQSLATRDQLAVGIVNRRDNLGHHLLLILTQRRA